MARSNSRRRQLNLESLEQRQVLSGTGPTEQAQYMIEVMNLVRTQPTQGAQWVSDHVDSTIQSNLNYYGVNLEQAKRDIASAPAKQPLAYDARLTTAAQQHSDDMAARGYQSHEQPGNSDTTTITQRLDKFGYGNRASYGENAFAYAKPAGRTMQTDVEVEDALDNALQAFLIDWGVSGNPHRQNIQQNNADTNTSFGDVGIGIADVKDATLLSRGFGPKVVTQAFGRESGDSAQIVGVVFEDVDRDGYFSYKEGRGQVRIEIQNLQTGQSSQLTNWDTGGYQQSVAPGSYKVSAYQSDRLIGTANVDVRDQNVKLDFQISAGVKLNTSPSSVKVTPPAPAPTPAPAPKAAPKPTPAPKPVTVVTKPAAPSTPSFTMANLQRTTQFVNAPRSSFVGTPRSNEAAPVVVSLTDAKPEPARKSPVVTTPVVVVPQDQDVNTGQDLVDEVLGNGLLNEWSSSRIVWGQGWKAGE